MKVICVKHYRKKSMFRKFSMCSGNMICVKHYKKELMFNNLFSMCNESVKNYKKESMFFVFNTKLIKILWLRNHWYKLLIPSDILICNL